jgi:hypothetical protein
VHRDADTDKNRPTPASGVEYRGIRHLSAVRRRSFAVTLSQQTRDTPGRVAEMRLLGGESSTVYPAAAGGFCIAAGD